jgi:hypothetical protein
MILGQDNGDSVQIKYNLEYSINLTLIGLLSLAAFVGLVVLVSVLVMITM